MTNPFAGTWTYCSFLNDPTLTNGDPQRLAALLFAEGTWTVKDGPPTIFVGELSFGADFIMDLKGVISPAAEDRTAHVHIIGSGCDGTPSADYYYDYDGSLTEQWPNGVNQIPAVTGSVIRIKPHSGEAAGLVASFILNKLSAMSIRSEPLSAAAKSIKAKSMETKLWFATSR